MTKVLHCRDAGFDCDAVVRGDTIDDILALVRSHAADVHAVELSPALESQVTLLVHDE